MFGRLAIYLGVSALLLSAVAYAETPAEILPLTRVRLYEAGVGYFERSGQLTQTARLPVPRSHLDDALKTLVILDGDGTASVSGVEFQQTLTRARSRSIARLPSDASDGLSFDSYVASLKGNAVELLAIDGSKTRGRLVDVLVKEQSGISSCVRAGASEPCVASPQTALLLLAESGEIQRLATAELKSVRPLDTRVLSRLRSAAAADERGGDASDLRVLLSRGARVTLGYAAEAPLWRSSYRLLLSATGVTLQGWALIHNDTDEGWRGVQVELLSGQPDSFLFPLAAPRYAERRLVTPDQHLPSIPQLSEQNADDAWDGGGSITLRGISSVGYGTGGGYGSAAAASTSTVAESSLLNIGNLAAQDESQGQLVGALFRYALGKTVDLGPRRSLLIPFLRESVRAERIAWFGDVDQAAKSTIVMTNTSKQTLPPGTVALFEGGAFAGESAIERWQPQATRFVHFGVDLDVALEAKPPRKAEHTVLISYEGEVLTEHYLRKHERACTVVNRGAAPRRVHLKLNVINNAKVSGADAVLVDTDGDNVDAVFALPEATRKAYTLLTEEALQQSFVSAQVEPALLRRWLASPALVATQRPAIERALKQLERRDGLRSERKSMERKLTRLDERLTRLTSTLDAVRRADSDAGERQAQLLVAAENQRTQLKATLDALSPDAALEAARRELSTLTASAARAAAR